MADVPTTPAPPSCQCGPTTGPLTGPVIPPATVIQPPIVVACTGGGLYLTAVDPSMSEDWSDA